VICSTCRRLSRLLESVLQQESRLTAAHLCAVQAGDLAKARQLDAWLFDASNCTHLSRDRLRDHEAAHRGTRATLTKVLRIVAVTVMVIVTLGMGVMGMVWMLVIRV
jgi:hypothetical protein